MSLKIDPRDWATVQPYYDALAAEELTAANATAWLGRWSELEAHLQEFGFKAYRAMTENTQDQAAEELYLYTIEELTPKSKVAAQTLKEKILALDPALLPAEMQEMLRRFHAEANLFREANVPLLTEVERLSAEFSKLMGAMSVEWQGETLTMQAVVKLFSDPDRSVREAAFKAYHSRFLQDRAAFNDIYLKQLKLRRQIAVNAGKASYLDYVWDLYGRFDYTPADCRTFHDAIEHEVVPLVEKWLAVHQRELGVESLRPWDIAVDSQSRPALTPFQSADQLESVCQTIFDRVDPELGAQYTRMRDGWLDLDSRPGKAPGGYCGGMFVSKVPYIFMNAVGTHDDVQTMLHEGGHAFHFMESSATNSLIWNYDGPTEFCEVASMAMELLAAPYLAKDQGGFYSETDARRARAEHLWSMLKFLPYMATVDAFQHWVYIEAPEAVTAEQLDAVWQDLYQRFMSGINWDGFEDVQTTGWHRKQHIFEAPLYYVEYGLAQLGAQQVWRNALADQAQAVAQYRSALALGNTKPLSQLFAAAGAKFAFDRATVGELARLVDQHLTALHD